MSFALLSASPLLNDLSIKSSSSPSVQQVHLLRACNIFYNVQPSPCSTASPTTNHDIFDTPQTYQAAKLNCILFLVYRIIQYNTIQYIPWCISIRLQSLQLYSCCLHSLNTLSMPGTYCVRSSSVLRRRESEASAPDVGDTKASTAVISCGANNYLRPVLDSQKP